MRVRLLGVWLGRVKYPIAATVMAVAGCLGGSNVVASPIPLGYLAWDETLPDPVFGEFDIINNTGVNAGSDPGSDFPVTTPVKFTSLSLTVAFTDGSVTTFGPTSNYFTLAADGQSWEGKPIAIGGMSPLPVSATLTGVVTPTSVSSADRPASPPINVNPAFDSGTLSVPVTITNSPNLMDGDLAVIYAEPACDHCVNSFNPQPDQPAHSFSYVLKGDVRNQVDTAATASNPVTNAFAYVNKNFFGGSGTSSVSVSLDGNGNTVITYTGSNPILPSYKFDYGNGPGDPHFGFEGTQGASLTNVSQFWNYGNDLTQVLPNLSAACPAVTGSDVHYAVFFADVSFVNAGDGGQWTECAFAIGTNPEFLLTNTTLLSEELSDVGFFLSDMAIPLDSLNFGMTPPPGQPSSPFTPLPQFDGLILLPNESVSFVAAAEPSTLALLGAGLGALFGWCRRSRPLTKAHAV
jgi:hypothetical protein